MKSPGKATAGIEQTATITCDKTQVETGRKAARKMQAYAHSNRPAERWLCDEILRDPWAHNERKK